MMIRRASGLILVAAAGLSPGSARAGFYSGEALLESCTADRTDKAFFEKSYECVGYVAGAVDAFNTTREVNGLKSCIPADVTLNQLKGATVDYLRANPDKRAQSASALVFTATRQAWPCPKAKAKAKARPGTKKKRN